MSTVTRRALAAWLADHGFAELGGKATSHRRFRHESGVVITVPGHGKQNLSPKHVGMIVPHLEAAGFDRDTVRLRDRDLKERSADPIPENVDSSSAPAKASAASTVMIRRLRTGFLPVVARDYSEDVVLDSVVVVGKG